MLRKCSVSRLSTNAYLVALNQTILKANHRNEAYELLKRMQAEIDNMKTRLWGTSSVLVVILVCLFPKSAVAYIGPGTGLSAIGAFVAVVAGITVALFGFLWYPIKRLLRKKKAKDEGKDEGGE